MLTSAGIVRVLLGVGALGMALLAVFYMRQRRMPFHEYILWGLVAIFIPIFGPFWVIYSRPGKPAWPRRHALLGRRKSIPGRRWRILVNIPKKWVTGR